MNNFLNTITVILSIGVIGVIFTWKPIEVGYDIFLKYDIWLALLAVFITFFVQIIMYSILFGMVHGVITLYEYINKKKDA